MECHTCLDIKLMRKIITLSPEIHLIGVASLTYKPELSQINAPIMPISKVPFAMGEYVTSPWQLLANGM